MRSTRFLALGFAFVTAACDDGFGPQFWDPTPDTVVIYSLSRPELLGLPSAYDAVGPRRVLVESPVATGSWDFALAEQNGGFVMLPAVAFGSINSRARIATMGTGSLQDITEAPGDTTRYSAVAVPIQPGTNYVLRTRTEACLGFGTGVRFAKLQALSVDEVAGTYRFAIVTNPYCNDRRLIPPEDND